MHLWVHFTGSEYAVDRVLIFLRLRPPYNAVEDLKTFDVAHGK